MAIIYENIITLTSTSIPIICSLIGIYIKSQFLPFLGQMTMAGI